MSRRVKVAKTQREAWLLIQRMFRRRQRNGEFTYLCWCVIDAKFIGTITRAQGRNCTKRIRAALPLIEGILRRSAFYTDDERREFLKKAIAGKKTAVSA